MVHESIAAQPSVEDTAARSELQALSRKLEGLQHETSKSLQELREASLSPDSPGKDERVFDNGDPWGSWKAILHPSSSSIHRAQIYFAQVRATAREVQPPASDDAAGRDELQQLSQRLAKLEEVLWLSGELSSGSFGNIPTKQ